MPITATTVVQNYKMRNYLIVIVGPTAIGKTRAAIEIARHFHSEIVSCDSRQLYKEMKIGTAVPTAEELSAVPHHFIQNKSIFDDYSVGDYEREVLPLLDVLFIKNPVQVLVGGSGLYVDAVLKGFDEFPELSSEIKEEIESDYQKYGITYLQEELEKLDPQYFLFLRDTNPQTLLNPQRMKRFVGVCKSSGMPYSSFLCKNESNRNFTPIIIGLEADREIMYRRIEKRVDQMMKDGLLEEVIQHYQYKHLNALQTVGYREFFSFLDGAISLETAVNEVKKNTRRFAKRQLTWFKRSENTKWFDYQSDLQNIIQHIKQQIQ